MDLFHLCLRFPVLRSIAVNRYIKKTNLSFKCDGKIFKEDLEKSQKQFLREDQLEDRLYIKRNVEDIVYCYIKYLSSPFEYFVYGFEGKSHEQRASYITSMHRWHELMTISGKDKKDELRDKFFFYKKMKPFFKREAVLIKSREDYSQFEEFCKVHQSFIAKINTGTLGAETDIYTVDNNVKELFDFLVSRGEWIVEELINQAEEMRVWNPSSVNTVRISSFMTKDGFKYLPPIVRTGRKGCCVDNAGAGGIFFVLDSSTGVAATEGCDKIGNRYKFHPDSGMAFEGWKLPQWEELLSLVQQCHNAMPGHKFIGWDFAFSTSGWVLVEGNWAQQFAWQICTQQGHREEFDKLLLG